MSNAEHGLKRQFLTVLGTFVITRVAVFALGYLSSLVIYYGEAFPQSSSSPIDLFYKWDATWYLSIVQIGYWFIPGTESNTAFFPMYPLLVKLCYYVIPNLKIAGYLVSNLALLFASFFLYRLVLLEYPDPRIAERSVFFLLISPVSFFFSTWYTEGLFLFFSISAVYFGKRRRWALASLLGAGAAASKMLGVFIVIPLTLEYLEIDFGSFRFGFDKFRQDFIFLLLIPLGLLAYMAYLYLVFGEPLAMVQAQAAWNRRLAPLTEGMANFVKYYSPFYQCIFGGAIVTSLFCILYLLVKRIHLNYLLYSVALFVLAVSTNIYDAMPRVLSVIFPNYLVFGLLAWKSEVLNTAMTVVFLMLLSLFTVLFVNGYWFT